MERDISNELRFSVGTEQHTFYVVFDECTHTASVVKDGKPVKMNTIGYERILDFIATARVLGFDVNIIYDNVGTKGILRTT